MSGTEHESPPAAPDLRARAMAAALRAWALLTRPSATWTLIEAEETSVRALFQFYLAPLAAIPPLASLLRMLASGQFGPADALLKSVLAYAASLAGVWAMGAVINAIADNFEAKPDRLKAMKVAVYASTPIWLAGIVFLLPGFDFFFVFSLYAGFLLHRGLRILMKAPADKLTAYASSVAAAAVVAFIVLAVLAAAIGRPRLIVG